MGSAIDDVAFLTRSEHRITVLDALAERPQSRADLRTMTGASSSTVRRLLCELKQRRWIRRNGRRYEATQLGAFVALGMTELLERFETERKLRGVWHWFPSEASNVSIETMADAVVTVAETDTPSRPVNRFVSLLRETERYRFVGVNNALLEPCKDEVRQRIIDGMETEIINPPSVARYILSTYREHCSGPLDSGNITVLLHDDVPSYGINFFDDRIAIGGYNPESGAVQALIEIDAPEVCEWAESAYDSYRHEARPFTPELAVE